MNYGISLVNTFTSGDGYPNHHKSSSAIGLQWRSRLNLGEFRTKEMIEHVFVQAPIMIDSVYMKNPESLPISLTTAILGRTQRQPNIFHAQRSVELIENKIQSTKGEIHAYKLSS